MMNAEQKTKYRTALQGVIHACQNSIAMAKSDIEYLEEEEEPSAISYETTKQVLEDLRYKFNNIRSL
jgi:hypothetical protein